MAYKIRLSVIILFLIFVTGTLGYHLLEGWSFLDSFYTTIITIATVGYGDFHPISLSGRLFTIFLVVVGVGAMAYSVTTVMENLVEGRIKKVLGRGKLEKKISLLKDHYIICGFGRIGYLIGRELAREKVPFIVIERSQEVIEKIEDEGLMYIRGSATEDRFLLAAGIERARGIVCVLPTDAENLYVILAAKELNPRIFILSRSVDDISERRLLKAGADRVMSPYTEGGMKMAMAILRPAMLDFIEITTKRQSLELRMEEVDIGESSPLQGKLLGESGIRSKYGLIVVAVKKETGRMIYNPSASYVIEKKDKLIALGEDGNLILFSRECSRSGGEK